MAMGIIDYCKAVRKKSRLYKKLYAVLFEAVNMNHWKRAHNICDRLERVRKIPIQVKPLTIKF